jgi:sugar lactone lactonase YvrE
MTGGVGVTCKSALGWALALVCVLNWPQAHADWLASQAQRDGSYATANDLATPTQATAETVRTLRLLGRAAEVAPGDGFLAAEPYHGTEYLARKIISGAGSGNLDASLVPELITHQNANGGFGESAGYDSDPLDTAFALDALSLSGNSNNPAVPLGVGYLLQQQSADGSWLDPSGASDAYTTALVARALFSYGAQFPAIASAVANAGIFLISQRNSSGSWGADFLTAQALLTLATASSDLASIQQSATALQSAQLADGSWSEDVYSTALSLRALQVAAARKSGTTATAGGGSIAGYVLIAGTNQPLANATVTLSTAGLAAQTNGDGYFIVSGVPTGNQTAVASKAGFASASAVGTVYTGQVSNIGSILLAQSSNAAVVRGTVFDAATHAPLGGVAITLAGGSNYSTTSASSGSFEVAGIAPGSYAVTFHANGYSDVSGSLTASAGSLTDVQQGLTLQGAFVDNGPGTLTGSLVDATTGKPVAGAQLILNGGTPVSSGSDGTFSFTGVARGNCQIQASATGYAGQSYSFVFSPGTNGQLGTLQLYPATGVSAANTLTIIGTVVDGVDGHALAGASVIMSQPSQTLTTDSSGHFTLSGLTALSFSVTISASGYQSRGYSATASGFGQLSGTFALTPIASGGGTATATILRGTVTDSVSSKPVAGAVVTAVGTNLTATAAADGTFELDNIQPLSLTVAANAPGYTARNYSIDLTQPGTYGLNIQLTPAPGAGTDKFQILSLNPVEGSSGANTIQHFSARITNLQATPQSALVLGDLVDATGTTVATVSPYAPGTTTPAAQVSFPANSFVDLTIPWNTAQLAPGTYRLALRVVQPGTVTRDLPTGVVLTQAETHTSIAPTYSILGQLGFNPPLSQAGTSVPVTLSALVINSGNVPLTGESFTLKIADPTSGQTLTTAQATASTIGAGQNVLLSFGTWIPTTSGNLPVTVSANDSNIQGSLSGSLYVGDKATGTFTVDRSVVPLGTQTVHASIQMQGVDVRTGTSTDPLFAAVKEAIRKGGVFVGPTVRQWNQTNRCIGCHIQTQSFTGMAAAMDKATIAPADVQYLYNDIVGSLQSDGTIHPSHSDFPSTQTALSIWALSGWHDPQQVFRTLYRGSVYELGRMSTSGNQSYWNYDHCGVWWCNVPGPTMMTVKGLAATLRMSQQIDVTTVNDYAFVDSGQSLGTRDVMGVQQTADGSIWFADASGRLNVRDPNTGSIRVAATGLGNPPIGLVVQPDGTAWVTSNTALTKVAPNGTTQRIPVPGSQWLWDMVQGPDGALYVADQYTNTIWRVTLDGTVSKFATGGLLNQPLSLSFDAGGNLFVANPGGWNIIQITPAGTMSVFSDGLPFQPTWLRRGPDGYLYAITAQYSNFGYTPPGLFRIDSQGNLERLPLPFSAANQYGFNSLAVINGSLCVNNGADFHLYCLQITRQDTSQLQAMRNALAGAARYTIATYGDNAPWNDIHAMRLITLAEARTQISDPQLLADIDTAIANIAALLRSRQAADGGWAYTTWRTSSDPYATAFIGMALDYTNPSVNDPVVRNSITFLLNSQTADGSWPYQNGPFTTKLGPTSFVMAYMPKALERLGGIDAGLKLTVPASVQLNGPSLAPTTQTTAQDGSTTYEWSLQGVTAQGRSVSFDLTLSNMTYQEVRPVATSAYLEFANSFTAEKLRSDLTIPDVRAVSALGLTVATDQATYPASSAVSITDTVTNVGPPVTSGQVHTVIRASDGTLVADLGTAPFGSMATGASTALPGSWNTGTLLAGGYQVDAQLYDSTGQLVDERKAAFNIVAPAATVTATVTPDKTSYQAWDVVTLTSRVRNVSANAIEPATTATLTVQTPSGATLSSTSFPVNSLVPGSLTDLPATLNLADAVTGDYPVQLVVNDAFTHAAVASASGTFHVNRSAVQALTGKVAVQASQVYQGINDLCTDTVTNLSSTALAGVTLSRSIVSLDTQAVIQTATQTIGLTGQQSQVFVDTVGTGALPLGAYACVLSATYNGSTRQIGAAGFQVLQPPIRIDASLSVGSRGRLLVLIDGEEERGCGHISEIELWAPFHIKLPDDAVIDVELQDANGQHIDHESVALKSYRGSVNQSAGKGADLIITGVSPEVLTVEVRSTPDLQTGYRIIATAKSSSLPPIVVDSGRMGSKAGWPLSVGARFGDFTSSDAHPTSRDSNHGDGGQHQKNTAPPAAAERTFLDALLKSAGWSYQIVTEEEDFEREMRSGAYSEYALLARHERLDEHARKELREAIFRGDGLLYAAGNDEGTEDLRAALGVREFDHWGGGGDGQGFGRDFGNAQGGGRRSYGEWRDPTGIELFDPHLSPVGTALFALEEEGVRVKLAGALAVGRFQGVPTNVNTAVTTYSYGSGTSVYVGYDLLAEATQTGSGSLHATLLQNALDYVKGSFAQLHTAEVAPLHVQLANKGIATPGQIQLPLPPGVTAVDLGTAQLNRGVLTWTFNLAKDQQLGFDAWLRLPSQSGAVAFDALIQTGTAGNYVDYTHATLTVNATVLATLADAKTLAATDKAFRHVAFWLETAQFWLDHNRPELALIDLLGATDELIRCPDPQSSTLRLDIDQVIWNLSRTL